MSREIDPDTAQRYPATSYEISQPTETVQTWVADNEWGYKTCVNRSPLTKIKANEWYKKYVVDWENLDRGIRNNLIWRMDLNFENSNLENATPNKDHVILIPLLKTNSLWAHVPGSTHFYIDKDRMEKDETQRFDGAHSENHYRIDFFRKDSMPSSMISAFYKELDRLQPEQINRKLSDFEHCLPKSFSKCEYPDKENLQEIKKTEWGNKYLIDWNGMERILQEKENLDDGRAKEKARQSYYDSRARSCILGRRR